MKTLDLTNLEKSQIKYKIQKFPDGQSNLVIKPDSIAEIKTIMETNHLSIQIKSRLNNWLDLELIVCTVASLRELEVEKIHLYAPYIMGARSDRKFEDGGNNYIKDVIAPTINALNFKTVTCIDPHSDVLEACITGFKKESNLELVQSALQWSGHYEENEFRGLLDDFILVSPDRGASKKIYKLAEQIGYKGDIITCSKERDNEGNITKVEVPFKQKHSMSKDLIIVDDICDGGMTFINIAKEIKEHQNSYLRNRGDFTLPIGKIYLIVTHSIFRNGFTELSKYFDGIYCTNSYNEVLKGSFYNYDTKDIVKQLNVF